MTAATKSGLIQWTLLFGLESGLLLFSDPSKSIINTHSVLRALINALALRTALTGGYHSKPYLIEKYFEDLGAKEVGN